MDAASPKFNKSVIAYHETGDLFADTCEIIEWLIHVSVEIRMHGFFRLRTKIRRKREFYYDKKYGNKRYLTIRKQNRNTT